MLACIMKRKLRTFSQKNMCILKKKQLLSVVRRSMATIAIAAMTTIGVSAQTNSLYIQYIDQYKDLAVQQMNTYGIPASITLAQAILESGAGTGELARKSNNHFGIKCGSSWNGRTTRHNDDSPRECFRVYSSVADSYEDHSRFLLRQRYSRLFSLDRYDYKAWARGLKACGYATNPAYADRLISLIERYQLYKYDRPEQYRQIEDSTPAVIIHQLIENNGILCVIAQKGDTWQSLSRDLDISLKKLLSRNEAPSVSMPITPGTFIYLEKKKSSAAKIYKDKLHNVRAGESMYSISQLYGIRLKKLYRLNDMEPSQPLRAGMLLKVR